VAKLTDYFAVATLRKLQRAFSSLARTAVLICDPKGRPLAEPPAGVPPGSKDARCCEAKILVGRSVVGTVAACRSPETPADEQWLESLVELAAGILGGLGEREMQLHARVEELAALFDVTADFAGQSDLQSVLDRVTATVVQVLKAKACSLRLLDEDKQELVIKSVANLSAEYLQKGPIMVSASKIDQEVLATGKPVYVADERTDPRVLYPAEARREGIVSALCAPMLYKAHPVGIIHVYTAKVHAFDWFEVSLLEAIASQAASAIISAQLHEEAIRAENISRALRMAGEVQRRMIPSEPPKIAGFDIGAIYVPCFELGGDFYDFIRLPPDNLAISICDVVGKGVRASLLMSSIRASLRAHASNIYSMSEVMALVNNDLCSDTLTSDFATLFYAVIDYKNRRFTYANAGHVPPMLFSGRQVRRLGTGGTVLGIDPDADWKHECLELQSGDVILACTDGLMEAMNFGDQAFGLERVEAAGLAAIRDGRDADGIAKHVLWEMRRFAGLQTRFDDLTVVVIKAL
jgi:sigma-B regulation protein RsbU (phosphoserine phosphatase)